MLGWLLLLVALPLAAIEVDQADLDLRPHLQLLADPQAAFEAAAVLQGGHSEARLPARSQLANLGYVRHRHWVRFELVNRSAEPLRRWLVLRRGAKHQIDGYLQRGQSDAPLQMLSPLAGQRHYLVELQLPPHSHTRVALAMQSYTALSVDLHLWSEQRLLDETELTLLKLLLSTGGQIAVGIFLAFLYAGVRDRAYLYAAAFAVCNGVYQLHFEGVAFAALWSHWPWLGSVVSFSIACWGATADALLLRLVTASRQHAPRLDRWLLRPIQWTTASLPLLYLGVPWLAGRLIAAVLILATGVFTLAVLQAYFERRLRLPSFVLAIVLSALAVLLFMGKQAGLLADGMLIEWLYPIALFLVALCFAVAVAERFRQISEDNRRAVARNEARLAEKVDQRTAELRQAKDAAELALDQLQSAQTQLVEAEKMASLGQLVAGVAHEVNTPLGVALTASSHLQLQTEGLRRQLDNGQLSRGSLAQFAETAGQSAAMIERNLQRAAGLIQSFKQVSVDRTADGRRQFDLRRALADLLDSSHSLWKHRPLNVELDCPSGLLFDSFPGALGQVVTNLLQNAVLHGYPEDGGGSIRVVGAALDDEHVRLSVVDDGQGMDANTLGRIFEPFFTTKRNQGGTGLGLHIVFNLVHQKLGGQIKVHSAPANGSSFVIELPRRAPT